MQTVRAADTNEVDKLIFRESDNDRKVSGTVMKPPLKVYGMSYLCYMSASCSPPPPPHFFFFGFS